MNEDTNSMNPTIERYLQGKLSSDEEAAFEEAYLADRELLHDLELAEKMREGFKGLEAEAHPPSTYAGRWRAFAAAPQVAAAASVLLVISVIFSGVTYVENQSLQQAAGGFTASAPTRLVPLFTVRGDSAVEISRPSADEWTVLVADPGFTEYDRYDATVSRRTDTSTEQVFRLDGLTPSYDGQLAIGMPGRLLESGDYSVEIDGRMSDWSAERESESAARFTFTVADQP